MGGRTRACLLLFLAAFVFALALPMPARAEGGDRVERLRTLFTTQPKRTASNPQAAAPAKHKPAGGRKRGAAPPPRPAPAIAAVPRKAADAQVLLVLGDGFAASLAQGLTETFAAQPKVRVAWRPAPTAGLAQGQADAWPRALANAVGKEKPAAVLVMGGSADRRRMRVDGGRAALLGDAWRAEYALRAGALAAVPRGQGVPLFWIGLPPVRDAAASHDFLAFNDIVRAALPPGGVFVDTWDGFADEAGAFASRGPGIDGLTVRLRRGDGFTAAGARKLAFFAARQLTKLLGAAAPEDLGGPLPGAPAALLRADPLPADAAFGGELLGGPGAPAVVPPALAVPLDPAVPAGRADDFRTGRP